MVPMRVRRTRYIIIAVVLCLLIWQTHRSSWIPDPYDSSISEHFQTELQMNHGENIPKIEAVRSSFDWASVEFAYPPAKEPTLPTKIANKKGQTKALPKVQHKFKKESAHARDIRRKRQGEVKKVFKKAWASYRRFAWGKDALKPISGDFVDQFSGWAATLVDSLDTLWIMGLKDEFYEAVSAVAKINFGNSTGHSVNTFETNIRYLGGLIAAYDLSGQKALLVKAVEVGDLLYAGFNTPNNMPVDMIPFQAAKGGQGLQCEQSVVSASPGTISLEFTRLSQITGDNKYYAAVSKISNLLYREQNHTRLPGMWPMFISMASEDVISGNVFTIGGNADSLYEYLPKTHFLLGGLDSKYETMSRVFMNTAADHLFFRPMLPPERDADILVSGNVDIDADGIPVLDPESEHLSCFIGGLFALGGKLLQNETHVAMGEKLARGCAYAYHAMPTGMMPERYNMIICPSGKLAAKCPWNKQAWEEGIAKRSEYRPHLPQGYTTAKDPRYILRPEAIESVFVLYRITGKAEWQDHAWSMFEAVANGTATEYANAAVLDVTLPASEQGIQPEDKWKGDGVPGLKKEDYMESFWLAETLKYFYLVFSAPDLVSLDEWVLNTEAHPFRLHH
jgi:mannosyl-oligosaccharide alpha-1,2-mannosidase